MNTFNRYHQLYYHELYRYHNVNKEEQNCRKAVAYLEKNFIEMASQGEVARKIDHFETDALNEKSFACAENIMNKYAGVTVSTYPSKICNEEHITITMKYQS